MKEDVVAEDLGEDPPVLQLQPPVQPLMLMSRPHPGLHRPLSDSGKDLVLEERAFVKNAQCLNSLTAYQEYPYWRICATFIKRASC